MACPSFARLARGSACPTGVGKNYRTSGLSSKEGTGLQIALQEFRFADFDGPSILADITNAIETTGQLVKLATFDGFEVSNSDFCGFRDLLEGDPFLMAQSGQVFWCGRGGCHARASACQ